MTTTNHKILILSLDNQPQFIGGIKKVCSTLGNHWIEKYNTDVAFITFCTSEMRPARIGQIKQYFFPVANNISAKENVDFLVDKVHEFSCDILLNPHVEDSGLNLLLQKVRPHINASYVGALHFSPIHYSSIVKESFFNGFLLGYNPIRWGMNFALWLKYQLHGKRKLSALERAQHRQMVELYDSVVLLSEKFITYFSNERGNVCAINNPTTFLPGDVKVLECKEKNVLWCGRLDFVGAKRVDRILRVWKIASKQCPDWHLQILGSGDTERLKQLIKKHEINNVEVLGFASPLEFYRRASILTVTSTVEGWSLVLVEAQSQGCVPMAFDSYASVSDIINDRDNGVLVSPFSIRQYADKLVELMKNDEMRSRMAIRGLETATRFDLNRISDQWVNLFDKLNQKTRRHNS